MNILNSITAVACVTASTFTVGSAFAHAAESYIAAGDKAADIQPTVDDFRAAVGGGKVAGPNGSFGAARREINWDGVPDAFAPQAVNDSSGTFPANFFNQNSPRGVVFSTPGTGFQVSMDDNNPADPDPDLPNFANINPNYIDEASELFSEQRLFTAVKSNITDISFFLPGTQTPATTTAFGSVFTDVERDGSKIEYFDVQGRKIGTVNVPIAGDVDLSFAGLVFDKSEIAKVRITSGQVGPSNDQQDASDGGPRDVAVMDDFIYGEPKINGSVAFSAPTYQVDEDDGTVKVTLERDNIIVAASVDVSTADGAALAGSDYTPLTTKVAFAAGESTKTVELPILSDRRAENDETFTVQLANPVELTLGETAKAAVTIRDRNGDTTAPSLSLLSATGKTRFRYRDFAKGVKLFLSASEGVNYQASVTAAKVNGTLKTAQGSNNGGIQSLVVKLTKKQVAALQKKRSKSMVIKLGATDQAGNATQKTLTLQLRK